MIWKIVGYIMLGVGRVLRRLSLIHLGHYLTGRGGRRELPVERLRPLLEKVYLPPGVSLYVVPGYADDDLWHAVGKIRVRRVGDYALFLDYYLFYPVCPYMDGHGPACGCDSRLRRWETTPVYVGAKPVDIIRPGFKKKATFGLFELEVRSVSWERPRSMLSVSIAVRDEFFADKGKPFWSAARVYLGASV